MAYASGRDETPEQASDRHWSDLLQELRVTETGAQVLFSLLLTVPFTARFTEVTPFQRRVYFAALLLLAVTAVLLLICDVLFSTGAAVALALSTGLVTLVLWFLPPLLRRRG